MNPGNAQYPVLTTVCLAAAAPPACESKCVLHALIKRKGIGL